MAVCRYCKEDKPDTVHRINLTDKDQALFCLKCANDCLLQGWSPCIQCGVLDRHRWTTCLSATDAGMHTICFSCRAKMDLVTCHCGREAPAELTLLGNCPRCVHVMNEQSGAYFYSSYRTYGNSSSKTKEIYFPRPFGVELESCTTHIRKKDTVFSSVRDGSILGQEFVSPILYGDDGAKAIRDLCALEGTMVDRKCGFHVHLNAKDLNWWQVLQIARGYTLVQSILFDMMPSERRGNRHCSLIKTPYFLLNTKEQILGSLYMGEGGAREGMKKKRVTKRYEFLNTHAFFYLGTVEIRLHEGTFNSEEILNWVNLNQALFHYFLNTPVHERDNPFTHFRKAIDAFPALLPYVVNRMELFGRKASAGLLLRPEKHKVTLLENDYFEPEDENKLRDTIEKWICTFDAERPVLGIKKIIADINDFAKLDLSVPKRNGGEAKPTKKETPATEPFYANDLTDLFNNVYDEWITVEPRLVPTATPTIIQGQLQQLQQVQDELRRHALREREDRMVRRLANFNRTED